MSPGEVGLAYNVLSVLEFAVSLPDDVLTGDLFKVWPPAEVYVDGLGMATTVGEEHLFLAVYPVQGKDRGAEDD